VEYCPECGGEMVYDSKIRMYTCRSCGLTLTYAEIVEARRKSRFHDETEAEKQKRREYLKWWLSKK
jgi:transcription initiation factor TFIIIB Brf1 subunit/transcription initiation factor TFIIB